MHLPRHPTKIMNAQEARRLAGEYVLPVEPIYTAIKSAALRGLTGIQIQTPRIAAEHLNAILTQLAKDGYQVKRDFGDQRDSCDCLDISW